MKTRTLMLALVVCFIGAAVCFAQDPNIGTWKLNEAKSQMPAGATKVATVVFAADGDNMKVTQEATDKDGKPIHSEWTGKFDGKDYPVTGNPAIDSRSYKKIDDRTMVATNKKDGKVVITARSVVSADGKTRTVNLTITDSAGKKVTGTAVSDKQ
ncbi:MAG TPA: hypothetical protein VF865_14330 [Acidobacteriaceae bacterium]